MFRCSIERNSSGYSFEPRFRLSPQLDNISPREVMANRFTRVVPKLFARVYRAIWFISRSRHRETHLTRSPTRPTVARGKNRMRRKQEHSEPSRGKLTFSSTRTLPHAVLSFITWKTSQW